MVIHSAANWQVPFSELQEQYLLKKIDTLTTDNDKLTADNAAKDAEIEALKKELASLQQNV